MYCSNCAAPLTEGTFFCTNCGRRFAYPEKPAETPDSPFVLDTQAEPVPVSAEADPTAAPTPEAVTAEIPEAVPESAPEAISESAPEAISESAPEAIPEPAPDTQPDAAQSPVENTASPPPARKRRPLLVPALILTALFGFGLTCFLLFPLTGEQDSPPASTPTVQEDDSSTRPSGHQTDRNNDDVTEPSGRDESFVPADERFFTMTEEGLSFLAHKYNGGPVLVIPNEIDGVPVTAIAPGGFAGMEEITTVILPDSLVSIGDGAFEDCAELRGVYFPETMRDVGRNAFAGCIRLESVSVPASMESIGQGAFTGCASLRYIFYQGTYEQWRELYNEYVTPFTYACCADGDYYHGVELP